MRVLALHTESFGSGGGIALHNRDALTALSTHPDCAEVISLPRLAGEAPYELPAKLRHRTTDSGHKARYLWTLTTTLGRERPLDLVYCGHINLLPLAAVAKLTSRARLLLVVHGVDAWQPTASRIANQAVRLADAVVAVSAVTRRRFLRWAPLLPSQVQVIHNAIHVGRYQPADKPAALLDRYGLRGKTVLLTLARLSALERYKGIDEILQVLPSLAAEVPGLAYLIVGDGDDRPRLERKARRLGLANRVVFAGYVPEADKPAHYHVADAFAMPGRGEGFGYVFLEAMACGIPVVASAADGSREAVLDGEIGIVVDPNDPTDLRAGLRRALCQPRGVVPSKLGYFAYDRFEHAFHELVDHLMGGRAH